VSLVELAKKLSRLGFKVEFFRDDGARAEDVSQAKVIGIKLGPEETFAKSTVLPDINIDLLW